LSVAGAAVQDDPVAKFYSGRQVMLYIPSAVGGGYDTYARLVGRYIGRYIPGNPTVVPVNMPGAGGEVVVSHLLTSAPEDGSVIAEVQPPVITAPLLSVRNGEQFDSHRLLYLGNASGDDAQCWVRSDAPVKVFQDAFATPILMGGGPGGGTIDLPTAENHILGTKFKIVSGYAGVNEVLLAIERNEVQGVCGVGLSSMKSQKPSWVDSGFVKMIVQESVDGIAALNKAGVPRTGDFAKTPKDHEALAFVYVVRKFGRPFAMPPGVPPERVTALRRAFMQALGDKDLLADARRQNLDVDPISGESLQSIVDELFKTPKDVLDRAKNALSAEPGQKN
jgi:tripartite-type tricarboxylate transporter receptor subunit TctC